MNETGSRFWRSGLPSKQILEMVIVLLSALFPLEFAAGTSVTSSILRSTSYETLFRSNIEALERRCMIRSDKTAVKLMQSHLQNFTKAGMQTVFDPFVSTGATDKICFSENRNPFFST